MTSTLRKDILNVDVDAMFQTYCVYIVSHPEKNVFRVPLRKEEVPSVNHHSSPPPLSLVTHHASGRPVDGETSGQGPGPEPCQITIAMAAGRVTESFSLAEVERSILRCCAV